MRTRRETFPTREEIGSPLTSSRIRSLTDIQYSYEMSQTSSHGRVLAGLRMSFQPEGVQPEKISTMLFGLYASYPYSQVLDVKLAKQAEQFLSMIIAPGRLYHAHRLFLRFV
jgi:hypothetical protein